MKSSQAELFEPKSKLSRAINEPSLGSGATLVEFLSDNKVRKKCKTAKSDAHHIQCLKKQTGQGISKSKVTKSLRAHKNVRSDF